MKIDNYLNVNNKPWKECQSQVFWGEIAPSNHVLQIYENDDVVISTLKGFVTSGFKNNESVIIIASDEHLKALNSSLILQGINLDILQKSDRYLPLNAEETLDKFLINGWPDETLFLNVVKDVINRARGKDNREVRAYGEMVAILWAKGNHGATVQLEHLWNRFCETEAFCLFCAYPKSGFTQDMNVSINHICSAHTQILSGDRNSSTDVFYQTA